MEHVRREAIQYASDRWGKLRIEPGLLEAGPAAVLDQFEGLDPGLAPDLDARIRAIGSEQGEEQADLVILRLPMGDAARVDFDARNLLGQGVMYGVQDSHAIARREG